MEWSYKRNTRGQSPLTSGRVRSYKRSSKSPSLLSKGNFFEKSLSKEKTRTYVGLGNSSAALDPPARVSNTADPAVFGRLSQTPSDADFSGTIESKKSDTLRKRVEVLEKENKSLQSLVRRSERHITEALKKAQEEEAKIFSLFLDVIKEKNIKIDISDLDDNLEMMNDQDTNNEGNGNSKKDSQLNSLLLNYISTEDREDSDALSTSLLALQRRALIPS